MKIVSVSDVMHLSTAERIQLACDIWDSIAISPDAVELTPEQKRILDKRIESYRKYPDAVIPRCCMPNVTV